MITFKMGFGKKLGFDEAESFLKSGADDKVWENHLIKTVTEEEKRCFTYETDICLKVNQCVIK